MAKLVIHATKNGKRYFVVNGHKIFITSEMTKKQISAIYKLLLKSVPKPKRSDLVNILIVNLQDEEEGKVQNLNHLFPLSMILIVSLQVEAQETQKIVAPKISLTV